MAYDKHADLRLRILQQHFPSVHEWNYQDFQRWRNERLSEAPKESKPEVRDAYEKYLEIREFTFHQAAYYQLFLMAKRDGEVEEEERLNLPSSFLSEEDYDYWCKADYWTDEEFVGLVVGRDPKRIRSMLSQTYAPKTDNGQFAAKLKDLLSRAYVKRHLDRESPPRAVLAWAKRKRIELPDQLEAAANRYGLLSDESESDGEVEEHQLHQFGPNVQNILRMRQDQPLPTPKPNRNFGTKERENLLKMVIGMGIAGYAHDPESRRNSTAKEISDDLASRGMSLDEDTIRKYLKQGAELLPRTEKPNSSRKPNSRSA